MSTTALSNWRPLRFSGKATTKFVRAYWIFALASVFLASSDRLVSASKPEMGRLVVQRSPSFGSKAILQLWIDGAKVANIGAGNRYDQPITPGPHVLAVNYTPKTRHQQMSMSLTVKPGETYAFTAIRNAYEGAVLQRSRNVP
jgi:hypothetical protein